MVSERQDLYIHARGVITTLLKICDGAFCRNSWQQKPCRPPWRIGRVQNTHLIYMHTSSVGKYLTYQSMSKQITWLSDVFKTLYTSAMELFAKIVNSWKAVKMVRVVNLKLAFTDWFFYNLIILIKLSKIRYLNLYKALLFPRNQVICLKNWKI